MSRQEMTVVTQQVQRSGPVVVNAEGNRDWSTGFCDICADKKICLLVFFCHHCYACYMSKRLGENVCLPLFHCNLVPMRLKIRMLLGIRGSICEDCCFLHWHVTAPCTLCQMAREMKAAGWLE